MQVGFFDFLADHLGTTALSVVGVEGCLTPKTNSHPPRGATEIRKEGQRSKQRQVAHQQSNGLTTEIP